MFSAYMASLQTSLSDRGPQFISQVWQEFCAALGATVSLSSGYHPQTNEHRRWLTRRWRLHSVVSPTPTRSHRVPNSPGLNMAITPSPTHPLGCPPSCAPSPTLCFLPWRRRSEAQSGQDRGSSFEGRRLITRSQDLQIKINTSAVPAIWRA